MANVVITKTSGNKIKIDFGSYFPGTTTEKTHIFPLRGWGGFCSSREGLEEGIEFHVNHETEPFKLSSQPSLTAFMQVDSVCGVVPTDDNHLMTLLDEIVA